MLCAPPHLSGCPSHPRPQYESHHHTVALLLAYGADPNAREVCGMRPLHVCTDSTASRQLVRYGADVDATDMEGKLSLREARERNEGKTE